MEPEAVDYQVSRSLKLHMELVTPAKFPFGDSIITVIGWFAQ